MPPNVLLCKDVLLSEANTIDRLKEEISRRVLELQGKAPPGETVGPLAHSPWALTKLAGYADDLHSCHHLLQKPFPRPRFSPAGWIKYVVKRLLQACLSWQFLPQAKLNAHVTRFAHE